MIKHTKEYLRLKKVIINFKKKVGMGYKYSNSMLLELIEKELDTANGGFTEKQK